MYRGEGGIGGKGVGGGYRGRLGETGPRIGMRVWEIRGCQLSTNSAVYFRDMSKTARQMVGKHGTLR